MRHGPVADPEPLWGSPPASSLREAVRRARPASRAGASPSRFTERPRARYRPGNVLDVTEPRDRDEQIAKLQADVAALHSRLSRAEQDAAAARFLAGGADRDGAETRRELREFREEARSEFADVRGEMRGFREQNNRVLNAMRADMTDGFTEMRRGFATAAAGQQRIVELLDVAMRQRNDLPDP